MFKFIPARWPIALLAAALITPWATFAQLGPQGGGGGGGYTSVPAPAQPGVPSSGGQSTLVIEGLDGINSAPISSTLRQALLSDWHSTGQLEAATYFINPAAIAAIERSQANGSLDPYLQPYVNAPSSFGCDDQVKTKTKNISLDWNGTSTNGPVGPFTGDLDLQADIDGQATNTFEYRVKRFGAFGVCIPYWVKFGHVRVQGQASLDGDISLTGSLSNNNDPWEWSRQLANPHLGSFDFFVGPIYVHIGIELPITAGIQAGLTVEANVDYENQAVATGTFDYTCTLSNCSGNSSFTTQTSGVPQVITGSIEGRAEIQAYIDVAVRAYLYNRNLAYAQVGIRPVAMLDLWGYFGNTCGDVECDSNADAVAALTASIDFQVFINAKARAIGKTWEWDDLWHSPRYHLAFIDFVDNGALDPMLHGPGTVRVGDLATYQARMRPCWPYEDDITYEVVWEDGTVNTFTKAPDEYQNLNRAFSTTGSKPISVTALHDAHGRTLNRTTTRNVQASVFADTDDPDCSAGGTDTSGGGGGSSNPAAQLTCFAQVTGGSPGWQMQCAGSGQNGLAPYIYQWRYENGPWLSGTSTRTLQCQALEDRIQLRVLDSNGQWSSASSAWCPGGIA